MRRGVVRALVTAVLGVASAANAQPVAPPSQISGSTTRYVVTSGDTLSSIGARWGVDPGTLAADNDLRRGATLREQQVLQIDNRHIVPSGPGTPAALVNIPQRMLFLADVPRLGVPMAVGRPDWPTPTGTFTIVLLEQDPTWDVPASILEEARRAGRRLPRHVPPGPDNPLGRFWIGLSGGSVGIHGTNAPRSIYQAVTHGCLRLHPDDIAWLFPRVATGQAVRIVYEPVLMAVIEDRVFLEAHRDIYRREPATMADLRARAAALGLTDRIDWTLAADVLALRHGIARDVTAPAAVRDRGSSGDEHGGAGQSASAEIAERLVRIGERIPTDVRLQGQRACQREELDAVAPGEIGH
jgi:L,D-transpeptidase ErfK/SrfK